MTAPRLALLAAVAALSWSGPGLAQGVLRGALVLEGEQRLSAEEGHVLQLAGRATLPAGGQARGSVVVLGGVLELEGTVAGDVFHLGGELALASTARVEGRLVAAGGELRIAEGATVAGGVVRDLAAASELVRPPPTLGDRVVRGLLQVTLLVLLALAFARWAPRSLDRTAEALAHHPVVAVSMGALSALVGSVLLVAMVATVVLIPVALIAGLGFAFAIAFGWLAWGTLIGRALARRRRLPHGILAVAIGTAGYAVAQAAVSAVPWVGGAMALLASVASLGAVVLTGFGVRRFVPDGGAAPDVEVRPSGR